MSWNLKHRKSIAHWINLTEHSEHLHAFRINAIGPQTPSITKSEIHLIFCADNIRREIGQIGFLRSNSAEPSFEVNIEVRTFNLQLFVQFLCVKLNVFFNFCVFFKSFVNYHSFVNVETLELLAVVDSQVGPVLFHKSDSVPLCPSWFDAKQDRQVGELLVI